MLTILCRHAHSDWQSTAAFLYVIGKSVVCKQGTILLEKHTFKLFYYIHIVEIPTNKRANSYKLKFSKIWNGVSDKESFFLPAMTFRLTPLAHTNNTKYINTEWWILGRIIMSWCTCPLLVICKFSFSLQWTLYRWWSLVMYEEYLQIYAI